MNMKKKEAIKLLHAIQNDYLNNLDDGESEYGDDISIGAVDSNRECIEALDMAIKALSR